MAGKIFTIYEPVYESNCVFYIGSPFDSVMSAVRKSADKEWFEDQNELLEAQRFDAGFCLSFKGKSGLFGYKVWTKDEWKDNPYTLLTLTHEILHLVMVILDTRGTPIERSNDEIICRMQGFYLRKCLYRLLPEKVAA